MSRKTNKLKKPIKSKVAKELDAKEIEALKKSQEQSRIQNAWIAINQLYHSVQKILWLESQLTEGKSLVKDDNSSDGIKPLFLLKADYLEELRVTFGPNGHISYLRGLGIEDNVLSTVIKKALKGDLNLFEACFISGSFQTAEGYYDLDKLTTMFMPSGIVLKEGLETKDDISRK